MKYRSPLTTCLPSIVVLTACGGGGGEVGNSSSMSAMPSMDPMPMTPMPMPMPMNMQAAPGEAALVGYLRTAHQQMLSAESSGHSYSLDVSSAPSSATTKFNGSAPAYSTVNNRTITQSHAAAPLASRVTTAYYLMDPYVPLGSASSSGSPYAVVTNYLPFPTTLRVGTSGMVDNLTYYHDSTMSTMDANETVEYAIRANDSATLFLCLSDTVSNVTAHGTADGLANGAETDCYTVDAKGHAALSSITLTVNGTTLSFM
jgi:hypothetical protein